jgi:hypothetical protein
VKTQEKLEAYVHTYLLEKGSESAVDYSGALSAIVQTTRRKYFDYFVFNIVDYISVNSGLLHSGARRRALAQIIGNARGARLQLAPECGKSLSRPAISSTSATR